MNQSCGLPGRLPGGMGSEFTTARIEMPMRSPMRRFLLALGFSLAFAGPVMAEDYASAISAYRRAHGLPAVRFDGRLRTIALEQARAMASTGSVSHFARGSFAARMAHARKSRAAENIGAGYVRFAEMLKQWEDSSGHRANLLMPGARRVGVASADNPKSPYRKFWAMVITD